MIAPWKLGRRSLLGVAGAAALAWPAAATPRCAEAVRRFGVLSTIREGEQEGHLRAAVLHENLRQLGWIKGQNLEIEYRCAGPDIARAAPVAAELASLGPELILAIGSHALSAAEAAAPAVPIVFNVISEPLDDRALSRLMSGDGNSAGFADFAFSIGGGWLDTLATCAPHLERIALIADPETCDFDYVQAGLEQAVRSRALRFAAAPIHNAGDIERVAAAFSRAPNGGLIVLLDESRLALRDAAIAAAARHRLPAAYCHRQFPREGGLISYSVDLAEIYRRCALCIDRVLRGSKANTLPLESPTKCLLTVNLRTARSLGLTVPQSLLELADETID